MTADRPTTEVDYYTWLRHFHGVRKHDAPDERPVKLHPGVARVACAIAAHVNNETRNAKLGHRRIAECAQVSSATVAKALPILEDAGWLIVERGQRQDLNTYRLASPVAALRASENLGTSDISPDLASVSEASLPHSVKQGASVSEAELRTSLRTTTTFEEHSVSASADPHLSSSNEPTELPSGWTPNRFHRSSATAKGLDVDVLAREFAFVMDGERRSDWGKAFGAFINEYADGREEVSFPQGDDVEDAHEPVSATTINFGPDPTTEAIEWVTPALWIEGINPDTLTIEERADVVLLWGDGQGARHVAHRIASRRREFLSA